MRWIRDLRYLPWRIKQGIINLYVWFPIIWNDRQWDQVWFYEMMYKKLDLMEKFYRSGKSWKLHSNRTADEIMKTRLALKRLIDDDYSAWKRHEEKWGELELWTTPDTEGRKHLVECNLNRTKVCNTESYEKERKESMRCYEHEEYLKLQDLEYVTQMIKKHVRGWWD